MAHEEKAKTFYISHKGKKHGPFMLATLSSRHLSDDMLAWTEGMPEWLPIAEIPELASYVRHAPPSRTTAPPRGLSSNPRPEPVSGPMIPAVPPTVQPEEPRPPRSGLATAMGIFNIIFSSLAMLGLPFLIFAEFAIPTHQEGGTSGIIMSAEARLGRAISFGVALLIAVLFLIAGIGLVRRRRWGRIMSIVAANASIFHLIGGCVFSTVAIVMPLQSLASDLEAASLQAVWIGSIGGLLCMNGTGLLYDLFLLIAMSIPSVKKSLG